MRYRNLLYLCAFTASFMTGLLLARARATHLHLDREALCDDIDKGLTNDSGFPDFNEEPDPKTPEPMPDPADPVRFFTPGCDNPTEGLALPSPVEGHCSPTSGQGYEIWTCNCHTAANAFCLQSPSNRGILVCGGNPESQSNPGDHTAGWEVKDGRTCIWNWGKPCCWDAAAVPPDISAGRAKACAQEACSNQYCNTTRCLPPGQLVEIPGLYACVREVGTSGALADCRACCDRRANTWSPAQWGAGNRLNFLRGCRDACDAVIGNIPTNIGCTIEAGGICGNSSGLYSPPNCCHHGSCQPMGVDGLRSCQ